MMRQVDASVTEERPASVNAPYRSGKLDRKGSLTIDKIKYLFWLKP